MGFFTFTPSTGINDDIISVNIKTGDVDDVKQGHIFVSNEEHDIVRTVEVNRGIYSKIFYTSTTGKVLRLYTYQDWYNADHERIYVYKNTYIDGQGEIGFIGVVANTAYSAPIEGIFRDYEDLLTVTLPDSITRIGHGTFMDCYSLSSITIPETVTYIGGSAFAGCTSLSSITIPEGVSVIEDRTFQGCTSLTTITIPKNVTDIRDYAFVGCYSLTTLTCLAITPPTLYFNLFEYVPLEHIYVPAVSVYEYKTDRDWSVYADIISSIP